MRGEEQVVRRRGRELLNMNDDEPRHVDRSGEIGMSPLGW